MEPARPNGLYAFIIDVSRISQIGPTILNGFVNQEKNGQVVNNELNECGALSRRNERDIPALLGKQGDKEELPDKVFKSRNSLLTDLLVIKHYGTIYNLCVAIAVCFYLHAIVDNLAKNSEVTSNLGLDLILDNIPHIPFVMIVWLSMQIATLLLYFVFRLWATVRLRYLSLFWMRWIWDSTFLVLILGYQAAFMVIPCYQMTIKETTVACSGGVLIEQVRFSVKAYSFLRTAIPRVLACNEHSQDCMCTSSISLYVYFLFAPTLIYRDEYPRTIKFRLKFFAISFGETLAIMFVLALVVKKYMIPNIQEFRSVQAMPFELLLAICANVLPSLLFFLLSFYAFCHSGFNSLAELLLFGDRLSYKDWWNSSSFTDFYRNWNLLVQNWLYLHVYKDVYYLTRNKTLANMLVFFISAVLHEYVLAFSFKFFYPVLSVIFGVIGMTFIFLPTICNSQTVGNIFFWMLLAIGSGIMQSLYLSERYARINCPGDTDSPVFDFFIPRSWYCTAS